MFKKLFGKKEVKPENLEQALESLLETIREESMRKNLDKCLQNCMDVMPNVSTEEVNVFLNKIFGVIAEPELRLGQTSLALIVCGYFVERGASAESLVPKVIALYKDFYETSRPFFDLLKEKAKAGEQGEAEEDLDIDAIYQDLLSDREQIEFEVGKSAASIEAFFSGAISFFSSSPQALKTAKVSLQEGAKAISEYSQGSHWLEKLFETLYDEPVVVINLQNNKGFEGKINGINDNFQLQFLLMSLPELLENPLIQGELLSIVDGTGAQSSKEIAPCIWNMYNAEVCQLDNWQNKIDDKSIMQEMSNYWIWGEGTPADISIKEGKRVILLGAPTYERTSPVQRTFKNLKANVEVERVLSEEEINGWLVK